MITIYNTLNCTYNTEVIVEVGVGIARWVAAEPWAPPGGDNCIALYCPLVTHLLGPMHCAMHCTVLFCTVFEREWVRVRDHTQV